MLQKLTRCILFFGVLLLLLIPVNMVLEPKNNTEEAGMYKASANAIQSQKADSIQVLFLGDSEAYSGFVPLELWNSTGIPSFVCSSLDQKMYETWELLQMAFECQSPKVVVLETNVLYRVYPSTDTIVPTLERYLPAVRYHNRWKSLTLSDFTQRPSYTAEAPDRGYHLLTAAESADVEGYMRPMEEWEPLSRQNRKYLQKIAELCREQNAQLILFSVPSPTNWTVRRHNTVGDTAQELGVPYLDGNMLELGIDWDRDSYDGGDHLNYYGAAKVTGWLGTYLQENASLTDCREDPDYTQWNRDFTAFRQRLAQAE